VSAILILAKPYDAEVVRGVCVELGHEACVREPAGVGEWVERRSPALVVLSTRLTQGEPADVLAQIRAGKHGATVPVVLLGLTAGDLEVDRLLPRPLDPDRLGSCIQELMQDSLRGAATGPSRSRVEAWLALVSEGDYFSLLELPRDAAAAQVDLAHARLCREFRSSRPCGAARRSSRPCRGAPGGGSGVRDEAAELEPDSPEGASFEMTEILEVLDEARRVLGDDEVREAYRQQLERAEGAGKEGQE